MVIYFEGPAGTGKTYNIIEELKRKLSQNPIEEWQKVLALTFMHGSRLRLNEKLSSMTELKGKYVARTIDSFAWSIVNRWRSLAFAYGLNLQDQNYDKTCEIAAKLLAFDFVLSWVTSVYPIIIVDEMQDCKTHRLEIIKNLSRGSLLIAAADGFQDLNCDGDSKNIEWLNTAESKQTLTVIQRTNKKVLIDVANRIRNGGDIRNISDFKIYSVSSAAIAGAKILYDIIRITNSDIAIITPAGLASSKFVKDIDDWFKQPTYSNKKPKPKLYVDWEKSEKDYIQNAKKYLNEISEEFITMEHIINIPKIYGYENILEWMDKQRRLSGIVSFPKDILMSAFEKIIHQSRIYSLRKINTVKGLVVHQAKNREFDYVYVLWPYEVPKEEDKLRRLLYNAVTRAKIKATIIQDPKVHG